MVITTTSVDQTNKSASSEFPVVIVAAAAAGALLLCLLLACLLRRSRRKSTAPIFNSDGDLEMDSLQIRGLPEDQSPWAISRGDLLLGHTLGEGAFGKVVKAVLTVSV